MVVVVRIAFVGAGLCSVSLPLCDFVRSGAGLLNVDQARFRTCRLGGYRFGVCNQGPYEICRVVYELIIGAGQPGLAPDASVMCCSSWLNRTRPAGG